jgi:hypothetical protein
MSLALGLEKREKSARLRCSNTVMLLTVSVLVFSVSGAMAQVRETFPPILSSGLGGGATPAAPPLIEHLTPGPATQSVFDAPSLPSIESIGAGSDIRPFLRPGVPADLTRAALRRAWSADPAIRDFIGLSENSWDFNGPDGVPGFGSLTTDGPGRLPARKTEAADSLDPARLAADRLTHDHVPRPVGEASEAPSSAKVK